VNSYFQPALDGPGNETPQIFIHKYKKNIKLIMDLAIAMENGNLGKPSRFSTLAPDIPIEEVDSVNPP